MNCIEFEGLIVEYINGSLSDEEKQILDNHLESCSNCKRAFEQYAELEINIKDSHQFLPDDSLKSNFIQHIEKETKAIKKQKSSIHLVIEKKHIKSIMRYAAILLIGFLIGNVINKQKSNVEITGLKQEVDATKNLVIMSLLESNSASNRIKAVGYSSEATYNEEIIKALLVTLNNDKNVNVRLAAANALYNFKDDKSVKESFIQSLRHQTDPRLQIRLIDILVEFKDENAIPEMFKMLQENELNETVKYKIEEGLGVLL